MNSLVKVFLVFLFLGSGAVTAYAVAPPGLDARQRQAFEALSRELNNDIHFFGKVVDLDETPVANARVTLGARVAGVPTDEQFPKIETLTDAKGLFSARIHAELLELENIEKEGYQYRLQYNRARILKSEKLEKRHGPGFEPDQPMVFRVRKLAPPAFVVIHNMTFGKSPGKPSMFDLIKRRWVHDASSLIAMQYSSLDRDWHTDILLSVEGEPEKLRLILETPDEASGFVVEKHEFAEVMTEAPEHGYRKRVEIPVTSDDSVFTAYVKAQGGLCYARIKITFAERQPGRVAINATSFTNLSGGRGLEYTPWVESQYDREVYSDHTRDLIRRADLFSGRPIELPQPRNKGEGP